MTEKLTNEQKNLLICEKQGWDIMDTRLRIYASNADGVLQPLPTGRDNEGRLRVLPNYFADYTAISAVVSRIYDTAKTDAIYNILIQRLGWRIITVKAADLADAYGIAMGLWPQHA